MKKLTNKDIDNRLIGRNIARVDNYINSDTLIKWQCLIDTCQYIWRARSYNILGAIKTGCPKCTGRLKLSNDLIDEKLKERSVRRIGYYLNLDFKIEWQCNNCEYIWLATTASILHSGNGCIRCAKQIPTTNDLIDIRLQKDGRLIKRLGDCGNARKQINWQCMENNCNHIWLNSPDDILNNMSGCPQCAIGDNEKLVGMTIKDSSIYYEAQKSLHDILIGEERRMRVDFYLPDIKTIIEYNGEQHYKPVRFGGISQERAEINFIKQQERDQHLELLCSNNNINLIWIDGRLYKNDKLKNYMVGNIIPNLRK